MTWTSRIAWPGSRSHRGRGRISAVAGALALLGLVSSAAATTAAHAMRPPAPVSPANGAHVQQLSAISWNAVGGAVAYEYEVSANSGFSALVIGRGTGKGVAHTFNLAAALEKTVPDGTYYWRVRGLTSKDKAGPWSRTRSIVKQWSAAPRITAGSGVTVTWPATPLVFRWSAVPYANKYIVSVATDPALSNIVLGTASKPTETQGTSFVMPISLAPGTYYWAITPVDAEGRRGERSDHHDPAQVGTFRWTWPSATPTAMGDLNSEAGVFDDPMFFWGPVPGAARYEVEVNSSEDFAPGSKWCCTGAITGTSLAPLQTLANNRYYWRVRAIDARGDAGQWNYGQPFEKSFDPATPTVHNLTVRTAEGTALGGVPETDTPIITWNPVPGASRYEVQLAPYTGGLGCDWTPAARSIPNEPTTAYNAFTATPAWTPLGLTTGRVGPTAWPHPQRTGGVTLPPETSYCFRVLARTDDDAQHNQVITAWTQINGVNHPAFTYVKRSKETEEHAKEEGEGKRPNCPPSGEGLSTPACSYTLPSAGASAPLTPLFTWKRVTGAEGYFVVIARDPRFTEVADVGFTNVPAYAPRIYNASPLSDETTAYYWAVIPTAGTNGAGVFSSPCFATSTNPCEPANDNPRWFDKSSAPPQPIGPVGGTEVSTQPSFRWSPAENARSYTLQVAQDPSFHQLIDNVTTDATAFTSSSTYPADTVVYWRVRANDWIAQGLNWSPTETFVRHLPVPALQPSAPTTVFGPAPVIWSPVQGAIAYDLRVEQGTGKTEDFTIESPSASFVKYYGAGVSHFQVRAEFPTNLAGKVAGAFSPPQSSLLILAAPSGARGTKTGSRLLVTWNAEPDAKQYQVEISTSSGFGTRIETHRVDGTNWAPNIDLRRKQYRGTLYWRVAPVDQIGGVGSFASGSFGAPRPHKATCSRKKRGTSRCGKR